jgi:hypothetical protein
MNNIPFFARQPILKSLTVFAVLVACLTGCSSSSDEQGTENSESQVEETDQSSATGSTEEETGQATKEDTSSEEESGEKDSEPPIRTDEETESDDTEEQADPEPLEQDEEQPDEEAEAAPQIEEETVETDEGMTLAEQEFAALSYIDQFLITSLQSWDWDTQPWVSANIESINVPEGSEFSVTLKLENFTESPIRAFDCSPTSVWDFFAGAQTEQQQCSPPALTTFDSDGVAVITATSTGEGVCWGVGGFGFEQGFICIPFGDLDGYSSEDCVDSELGEGFLFPLSNGAYWCNYGEISRPLDTNG